MALVGYARVSTEEQDLAPQLDALRAAGCAEVFEEHASGAGRARPRLAAALARLRRGDTLVVARIDRLARSLSHLLDGVDPTMLSPAARWGASRSRIATPAGAGVQRWTRHDGPDHAGVGGARQISHPRRARCRPPHPTAPPVTLGRPKR